MRTELHRPLLQNLIALVLALACGAAAAQGYPARPIRVIVPLGAGGPTDLVARLLAERMAASLGQPVVVENRPGAGAVIGTEAVAKAAPDGYTIGMVTTPHVVNPSLVAKLPYDTLRDFAPVSLVATLPLFLTVGNSVPAASVAELLALARAKPGELNMASAGNGTGPHLAGELLKMMTGISVQHVPYKGAPQASAAIMSADATFYFDSPIALANAKAGKLRVIAVTTASRSMMAPEVPTVAESGVPGYEVSVWNALVAPAGTPADVVARLNAEARRALADPQVKQRLAAQAFEVVGSTPGELASRIAADVEKWARVVKASGMRVE